MRIGLAGTGRIGAFHAKTLSTLDGVDELVLADLDTALAERVATGLGVSAAASIDALLDSGLDRLRHHRRHRSARELLEAAIARDIPTFCEKPVALDLERTIALTELEAASAVPGAHRLPAPLRHRLPPGARCRGASGSWASSTPSRRDRWTRPRRTRLPGPRRAGMFRDCSVHDFDIIRFVTGREVSRVFAVGANKGESSSPRPATSTRRQRHSCSTTGPWRRDLDRVQRRRPRRAHGGARLEGHPGRRARHDARVSSPSRASSGPPGPRHWSFMERFLPAYVTELTAFVEVAQWRQPEPVHGGRRPRAFRTAEACARSMSEPGQVDLVDIPTVRSDLSVRA
jgi:myo-inositol 2-dehydrogenase/D-chiro-inositol 1-dehydrogenase